MRLTRKKLAAAAAASLFAFAGTAFAQSTPAGGWYAGGAVGASTLRPRLENAGAIAGTQDTRDTGFKLLAGYQFNAHWAVEGQYQDLGRWKYAEPGLAASARVHGLSVAAVGLLPVGHGFTLLGKLGLVRQSFDVTARDTAANTTGSRKFNKTMPLVGFGAEYDLTPALALRAEYEYFGVPTLAQSGNERIKAHTALLSVGLRYRF